MGKKKKKKEFFIFLGRKTNGENKTDNFRCIVTTKDLKISQLYFPRKKIRFKAIH
jgi:hypothetical protein